MATSLDTILPVIASPSEEGRGNLFPPVIASPSAEGRGNLRKE